MSEDSVRNDQSTAPGSPTPADVTPVTGTKSNGSGNGAAKPSRPSVVPLSFKDKQALQRAYMPFMKGGGLFLPTAQPYEMNEEIFLLVTLPGSKKSLPVPGTVVWQNPSTAATGKQCWRLTCSPWWEVHEIRAF